MLMLMLYYVLEICPCAVSAKEKLESLRNSKGVSSQRELEKENRALKRKHSELLSRDEVFPEQ